MISIFVFCIVSAVQDGQFRRSHLLQNTKLMVFFSTQPYYACTKALPIGLKSKIKPPPFLVTLEFIHCSADIFISFVVRISSQKFYFFRNVYRHVTASEYVVQCTELYCTVLYCTIQHCTLLYYTVLYCVVLHFTCTLLCCTILYFTLLHCTK